VSDDHLYALAVEFEDLRASEVIAIREFFQRWGMLVGMGSSRPVGFFVDGDGAMRSVPEVEDDLDVGDEDLLADARDAAERDDCHGLYDPDGPAWVLSRPHAVEAEEVEER
jgi:hypothetical protein